MAAWRAQIGSISVTSTRAPRPRSDCGAALAHVAVAADHGHLAGHHHVGGALDAVDQRLAAAVEVVELGLGHRVVDVDRRDQQAALARASGRGGGRRWWSPRRRRSSSATSRCQSFGSSRSGCCWSRSLMICELLVVGAAGRAGSRARSRPRSPVDQQRGVAAVVDDQVRAAGRPARSAPARCTTSTPPGSRPSRRRPARRRRRSPPRRGPGSRRCCSDAQRTSAPSFDQGLDQHGGLDGHVQQPVMRAPGERLARPYFSRMAIRPGISCSAISISRRPRRRGRCP